MLPLNLTGRFCRLALASGLLAMLVSSSAAGARPLAQPAKFADPAFERTWQRTDLPVAKGLVARTWFWGPQPGVSRLELLPGSSSPRLVQYFDKARMEISDPKADPSSPWYVTNGLLTVELIKGELLVDPTAHMPPGPANIPLASDLDDANAPTYASFRSVADVPGNSTHGVGPATGQAVAATINRAGQVGQDPSKAALGNAVKYAHYEPITKHNIPGAFWDFLNSVDLVYEGGQTKLRRLSDPWFYATGYPISEAYWARVRIAGQLHDVMIQTFQRRVLTYVPDNPASWRVQMSNSGQHYYQWRYGTAPSVATPEPARPTGRIAFASNRAGAMGIFTMASDGSDVRQVASTSGGNFAPRFAPDAKRLVYYNVPPGPSASASLDDPALFPKSRIMFASDAPGGEGTPLGATSVANWDAQADPAFSPNGMFLAFRGKPAGEQEGLFAANLASDAAFIPVMRLTTGAWDRQPVWSPDGKTIAFTSGSAADNSHIWIIGADGSGKRRLTDDLRQQWDADPAWSPDGKRIVYASTAATGKYDISQVMLDGTVSHSITGGDTSNQRHPFFSPDGAWLVFSSDKEGNQEIYVAPADGSRWTNISHSPSADGQPSWVK
ncbi:MAG: hypothetical protein ACJ78Q_08845 [Chloroflexia bacterium]